MSKGYSQAKVEELTHVDVSKYESGVSCPSFASIYRSCNGYNVYPGVFFILVDEIRNKKLSIHQACKILEAWEAHKKLFELILSQLRTG
ncbi:MAG: helix-turn-helix transcriptional regulator [Bacteroidota bacterium]|nr:helix-turn-helix transcriptional regulator [Bacteroidota bacterium]